MGKPATRAKNKYNAENYDRVSLSLPKGRKEELMEFAKENGYTSLNQFIADALDHYERELKNKGQV